MTSQHNHSGEFRINRTDLLAQRQFVVNEGRRTTSEIRLPLSTAAACIETDASGFISSWSLTAERLFKFECDEIIGKHISILYCEDDLLHGRAAHELNAARSREDYRVSGWQRRKDGSSFWSYSESKKTDGGYRLMVMEVSAPKK